MSEKPTPNQGKTPKPRVMVSVPPELHRQLQLKSRNEGFKIGWMVSTAIKNFLGTNPQQ